MSQSYKISSHQSNTMQFCDHKRSSRHCGFYSPQVSSLDNTSVTNSDMREVVREEEDEYVVCDSDASLPHLTRDTSGLVTPHVSSVPSPLARILDRRVSTCPVLVSHLLASHYSTRYVSSHHISHSYTLLRHHGHTDNCSDCSQFAHSLNPGLQSVLEASNRLQWSSRLKVNDHVINVLIVNFFSIQAHSYPVKQKRDRTICCIQYFATFSLFIPLIVIIVLLLKLFNVIQ